MEDSLKTSRPEPAAEMRPLQGKGTGAVARPTQQREGVQLGKGVNNRNGKDGSS